MNTEQRILVDKAKAAIEELLMQTKKDLNSKGIEFRTNLIVSFGGEPNDPNFNDMAEVKSAWSDNADVLENMADDPEMEEEEIQDIKRDIILGVADSLYGPITKTSVVSVLYHWRVNRQLTPESKLP